MSYGMMFTWNGKSYCGTVTSAKLRRHELMLDYAYEVDGAAVTGKLTADSADGVTYTGKWADLDPRADEPRQGHATLARLQHDDRCVLVGNWGDVQGQENQRWTVDIEVASSLA